MSFDTMLHMLSPTSITILRNDRQRRKIDDDEDAQRKLQQSIQRNGLINPIVVRIDDFGDHVLVAGERRLRAIKALEWPEVPARFVHELDAAEAAILELEENIARKDLSWQDTMLAVTKLHELHLEMDPKWSQLKTSETIALSDSTVSLYVHVALYKDDPRIMEQATVNKALSIIKTMENRKSEAAYNALFEVDEEEDEEDSPLKEAEDLLEAEVIQLRPDPIVIYGPTEQNGKTIVSDPMNHKTELIAPVALAKTKKVRGVESDILHTSFLDWAPKYKGRRFNFIHVDFPYGVEEIGPQMVGFEHTIYNDSPEIYINLLNCFCDNLDRFMAESAWCMFWYSERMGAVTREIFKVKAPSLLVQHHPLIWLHSDNAGISSDHTKRPRHIYDTALLMGRGEMPLAKLKSDAYSCPTDRRLHPSTKPEPMLKYFFEMFVDHHTSIFDPTCGAGSSLRAAESLGAGRVLGIEAEWGHVETARRELQNVRNLYKAAADILALEPT